MRYQKDGKKLLLDTDNYFLLEPCVIKYFHLISNFGTRLLGSSWGNFFLDFHPKQFSENNNREFSGTALCFLAETKLYSQIIWKFCLLIQLSLIHNFATKHHIRASFRCLLVTQLTCSRKFQWNRNLRRNFHLHSFHFQL